MSTNKMRCWSSDAFEKSQGPSKAQINENTCMTFTCFLEKQLVWETHEARQWRKIYYKLYKPVEPLAAERVLSHHHEPHDLQHLLSEIHTSTNISKSVSRVYECNSWSQGTTCSNTQGGTKKGYERPRTICAFGNQEAKVFWWRIQNVCILDVRCDEGNGQLGRNSA